MQVRIAEMVFGYLIKRLNPFLVARSLSDEIDQWIKAPFVMNWSLQSSYRLNISVHNNKLPELSVAIHKGERSKEKLWDGERET